MVNRMSTQRLNAYFAAVIIHGQPCENTALALIIENHTAMFIHGQPCKNTAAERVFRCRVVHGVTVQDMAVPGFFGKSKGWS